MNLIKNKISLVLSLLFLSNFAFAGTENDALMGIQQYMILLLLGLVVLIVFAILGIAIRSINNLADLQKEINYKAKGMEIPARKPEKSMFAGWTNAVDIDKEADIDLGHDYDGIRELDNVLPPWWVAMFYMTIVFAIFYSFYYTTENDQYYEYRQEMLAAQIQKEARLSKGGAQVNEKTVVYQDDEATLADGAKLYASNCKMCHGENAEGTGTFPNLTDEFWLHGGGINNIFKTVSGGVPGTGMTAFGKMLNPTKISKVSSYIWSLQGSNPANAKEAQGDKWVPEEK